MTLTEADMVDEGDEQNNEQPGSPSSEHNSWSSAETVPAPPPGSPGDGADGGQRRPKRCKISREQLSILIKSFDDEPLPNFDQRQALAKILGMTPRSVQIWFQNRRQRLKPMQPKSSSSGNDYPSSSQQLPYLQRPQTSSQTPLQSFGMPGLAAVAGLCHGFPSSEMMSKAMSQLPQTSGSLGAFAHSMGGLPYDVMEPFAATKALLGAGYQPPASLSLASRLHAHAAVTGCSSACGTNHSTYQRGSTVQCAGATSWDQPAGPVPAGPAAASSAGVPSTKSPAQADGLLLLLACADGNSGQPASGASELAAPEQRSAIAY